MRLVLSNESVQNMVMTNETGQVLYKTSTPFRFGIRTTTLYKVVPNESPEDMLDNFEVIGEIVWHWIGPSTMRLHGEEMKTNQFIPRQGIWGTKRTFTGPDGRSYKWDMDFSIVRLSRNDDQTEQELARSHRRHYGLVGSKRDPYLEVHPDLGHMLDMVILTFIYVDKLRMDNENAATHSA
ncbi:hypothetical protein J3A83DRAFT_13079 [Scleroderma citrinum]